MIADIQSSSVIEGKALDLYAIAINNTKHMTRIKNTTCRYKDFFNHFPSYGNYFIFHTL